MCCHLKHGEYEGRNLDRLEEIHYIEKNLKFAFDINNDNDNKYVDLKSLASDRYDYVFLFGDLNFRISCDKNTLLGILENKDI